MKFYHIPISTPSPGNFVVLNHSHRLASERVDNLLGVKVLLPSRILREELARSMTEQFVIGDLELKRTRIPGVVEINIIRVDEGEFLICVQCIRARKSD